MLYYIQTHITHIIYYTLISYGIIPYNVIGADLAAPRRGRLLEGPARGVPIDSNVIMIIIITVIKYYCYLNNVIVIINHW